MNIHLFLSLLAWPTALYAWPCFFINFYRHVTSNGEEYVPRLHTYFVKAYIATAVLLSL